jgi:hypothetical protein
MGTLTVQTGPGEHTPWPLKLVLDIREKKLTTETT